MKCSEVYKVEVVEDDDPVAGMDSHGYCAECTVLVMAELEAELEAMGL